MNESMSHEQLSVLPSNAYMGRPLQDTRSQNISSVSLSSLGNDSVGSYKSRKSTPCIYFLQGMCRHGDRCRFSHGQTSPSADQGPVATATYAPTDPNGVPLNGSMQPLSRVSSWNEIQQNIPSPIIVNIPPEHPVFSIDVECVATGIQHNARSVAQVALVDEFGRPVLNVLIKQEKPVVSYLTPLTGLTKDAIDNYGLPLADAMAMLRAYLPPNAILVGQNIQCDVQWLQLAEGVDYHSFIDLSSLFRVWDVNKGSYVTFSQDHCASVWIGLPQRSHHDAVADASISIALFNAYRQIQWDPVRLRQMQAMTLSAPRIPGFSSLYPVLDNCCMGNRRKCICGAPFRS